ncbi:MAG: hypothetical protein NVS9B4_23550 [Candidatus Acidiferrum sp.]
MGSYVAFSTNTGSCISDPRRDNAKDGFLLAAGESAVGVPALPTSGDRRPRGSTEFGRMALIALPWVTSVGEFHLWPGAG